jgi:hypothetical protein
MIVRSVNHRSSMLAYFSAASTRKRMEQNQGKICRNRLRAPTCGTCCAGKAFAARPWFVSK